MSNSQSDLSLSVAARKRRLSIFAKAGEEALAPLFERFAVAHPIEDYTILRVPEVGTSMVRGRTGGSGAAFNLGEMSVTRISVRLPSGAVGHGYVQGRSKDAARMAALLDAMAEDGFADGVDDLVTTPLEGAAQTARAARAAKAAATKVEFFTMVRGEG
ncbi:phosphonate C-P lyase system protein PhnG [Rhodobacteraceae bacterium N5(2021)]|uniref:Phosphonate C-P lyase system protein PhnG n=1 Tax=Gymnodinialimonas phycosphaerae TaxID=2841589 RepID=A0A975YEE3_9RHOB|nr:phosphonate C-P lyase system protein PhnG [Gymnodinialimonas phycosphaerae]MBY4893510.1 phosphonate C-P lyase system protein PhnG [Gymnodinialimonas phycosphaerae]